MASKTAIAGPPAAAPKFDLQKSLSQPMNWAVKTGKFVFGEPAATSAAPAKGKAAAPAAAPSKENKAPEAAPVPPKSTEKPRAFKAAGFQGTRCDRTRERALRPSRSRTLCPCSGRLQQRMTAGQDRRSAAAERNRRAPAAVAH